MVKKNQPLLFVGLFLIIVLTFNSILLTYASKSVLTSTDYRYDSTAFEDLKYFALSKSMMIEKNTIFLRYF